MNRDYEAMNSLFWPEMISPFWILLKSKESVIFSSLLNGLVHIAVFLSKHCKTERDLVMIA